MPLNFFTNFCNVDGLTLLPYSWSCGQGIPYPSQGLGARGGSTCLGLVLVIEVTWIQLETGPAQTVVIAEYVPVPHSRYDVDWPGRHDIHRLVPSRIETLIDRACLRESLLVFVSEHDIRVTETVDVASLQVLGLDDFDGEHELVLSASHS